MMPMEDCVNCSKERSILNHLWWSSFPYTPDGLHQLMGKELNLLSITSGLKRLKVNQVLFLHVFHETGRNINDENYSIEQAAKDILDKNLKLFQSCEKYLLTILL
jgi:hypothetical protein